ncbi:MAG: hypothetical protein V3R25_05985 [Nitrosomonadaceae bacterium]
MIASHIKTSFKGITKKMLTLATLTLSINSHGEGYADIGYNKNLSVETVLQVDGPLYMRAEVSKDLTSYGLGLGYDVNYFNVMATVDFVNDSEFEYGLQASYYDIGLSYFAALDYSSENIGYRIGAGYSLNEGVSIITHYSDNGLFIGFRKWFN